MNEYLLIRKWQIECPLPHKHLIGNMFTQRLADHIIWGCFRGNHASYGRLILNLSSQSQRTDRDGEEDMGRAGINDRRINKELESTGVKQLAEKLAMVADLLKYSPHSEITDVHSGICVSVCNLLLSMSFPFYLPPTHSSLLPGHHSQKVLLFSQREPAPPHLTKVIFHLILEEKDLHSSFP